jgi:nitronate monooxygenase
MALQTAFTELMGVRHPIALAPMSGTAGGALAAAVSNGGGLGLVGGGRESTDWVERELKIVTEHTSQPWGIGFLSWAADVETVERALAYAPGAVMLSFGDPEPFAAAVHASSARLIVQVTNLEEARRALDVGADVIVAQGTEAGGHGGMRSTFPFVPAVVDRVRPTPVLAAGGIADGRGLAAALALGGCGALVGTRFEASDEALVDAASVKAILNGEGEDTERSRVLDIARGSAWPARYTGRTLRNAFLEEWRDRPDELASDTAAQEGYRRASARGDMDAVAVWAGEAIDLITETQSAGDIVAAMVERAEDTIRGILGN